MKKSKIIVPALGVLLLSTAASISGTVAWFTASRTFSTHVNAFSVGSVDGNLSGVVAGVVGSKAGTTTVANDTAIFAVGDVTSILTDASYDCSSGILYTDEPITSEEGSGVNTSSFIDLGTTNATNWKAGSKSGSDYYYAVQWTITLKYEGSAIANDVHIFFDQAATAASLKVNGSAAVVDNTADAAKLANGIRFCMESTSKKINYAPLRTGTIKNVCATSGASATENTTPLIDGDDEIAKLADNQNASTAAANAAYLGTVAPDTDFVVTVTCWLDGLDADVLTANLTGFSSIQGSLCFYCRTAANA